MVLPKLNTTPQKEEKQEIPLRETKRWKRLYNENLVSAKAMRGTTQEKKIAYEKMIDKLASQPPVDQHNIMAGFGKFAGENFKWTSDKDED